MGCFHMTEYRGGKSTGFLYLSRSTDTFIKNTVKVEALKQLYSSKSEKVLAQKSTQSKKVKSSSL